MSDNAVDRPGSLCQNDQDFAREKQSGIIGQNEKATTKGNKKVQINKDSSNSLDQDQVVKDKEFESPVQKQRSITRRQIRKESRTSVAANYYSKMNSIEGLHYSFMSRSQARQDPLLQSLIDIKDKVALNDKQNGTKEATGESPTSKMEQKPSPLVLKKYQSSTTKDPNKVSARSKVIKKPSQSSQHQNDEIHHKTGKQPSQSVQKNQKKQPAKIDNKVIIECEQENLQIDVKQKDIKEKNNALQSSPQIKSNRKKKSKPPKIAVPEKIQKGKTKKWKSSDQKSQSAYSQHLKEALKQKMRQQQYQKALRQSGRNVLKNLINKQKIKQTPENFSKQELLFENKDLENNFANFMKVIKFKHQKHILKWARRDESQISYVQDDEEEGENEQEEENDGDKEIEEPYYEFQRPSQFYSNSQIQKRTMEQLQGQVQIIFSELSLNNLRPESITQEICEQIVSLLEDQPEHESQIVTLKQYYYQKELILYSSLLKNKSLEDYHKAIDTIQNYEDKKNTKRTVAKQFSGLDPNQLTVELEVLNARSTLKDIENKFSLAHTSILTLALQEYQSNGEFGSPQALNDKVIVNQISIDDESRQAISKENPFFEDLYNMINSIITVEGSQFSQFKEKVEQQFPSSLELYDKFIRRKTSTYTIELGKIQEVPNEDFGASINMKQGRQQLDEMLSKYGVTMHSLLFNCDQALQSAIIQGFCDQDKQIFQQQIKHLNTNIQSSLQNDNVQIEQQEKSMKETQQQILKHISELKKLKEEVDAPKRRSSKISINLGNANQNKDDKQENDQDVQNLLKQKLEQLNGLQAYHNLLSNNKSQEAQPNVNAIEAAQEQNKVTINDQEDQNLADGQDEGMLDRLQQQLQQQMDQQQLKPGTSIYYDHDTNQFVEIIELEQNQYQQFMEADNQQADSGIQNAVNALSELQKANDNLVNQNQHLKQEGFEQRHVVNNSNDQPVSKEEDKKFSYSGSCRKHVEICNNILQTRNDQREAQQSGQNIEQDGEQELALESLQAPNGEKLNVAEMQYQQQTTYQQVIGEDGQMYLIALQPEPSMQQQYGQPEEEQLQVKTEEQIRFENDQVQNQLKAQQNTQMKTEQEIMQMQINSTLVDQSKVDEQQAIEVQEQQQPQIIVVHEGDIEAQQQYQTIELQQLNQNQSIIANQQLNPQHQLNSEGKTEGKEDKAIQDQKELLMAMQNCITNNQQLDVNAFNGLLPPDIQQQVDNLQQLQQQTQAEQLQEQQQQQQHQQQHQQPEEKLNQQNGVAEAQNITQADQDNCEEIQVITEDQNGQQQIITLKNQQELAQYIQQIQQQQQEEEQQQMQIVDLDNQNQQNNAQYYKNAQELNNHIETEIQNLSNQLNIQNRDEIQHNQQQTQALPELFPNAINQQQIQNQQEQVPDMGQALTLEQIQQQTDIEAQLQQQLNQLQQQQLVDEGNQNLLAKLNNLHQFSEKEQHEIIQALQQQQQLEAQNQQNQQNQHNSIQANLPPAMLQQQAQPQPQQQPQMQNQSIIQNNQQQQNNIQTNMIQSNQPNQPIGQQAYQQQLIQQLQQQQNNQDFQLNEQSQALLQQQLQAQLQAIQVQQPPQQQIQQPQTQIIQPHGTIQQPHLNTSFQPAPQQLETQNSIEGNASSLTMNQQNQLLMQRMQYMYRNNAK